MSQFEWSRKRRKTEEAANRRPPAEHLGGRRPPAGASGLGGLDSLGEVILEGLQVQGPASGEAVVANLALLDQDLVADVRDAHGVGLDFDDLCRLDDISRTVVTVKGPNLDFLLFTWGPATCAKKLAYRCTEHGLFPY